MAHSKNLEPYRIGIIQDWMIQNQPCFDQYDMTRMAFDEAYESGLVDRPIELVIREINGVPFGQMDAVVVALRDLVEKEECIGLIGPLLSDSAIACNKMIDAYRIPSICYTASINCASEYLYQLPNGTFPDEMGVVADYLQRLGCKSVACLVEDNLIGKEYYQYFVENCERLKIKITATEVTPTFMSREDAVGMLYRLRQTNAESLCYLGYGAWLTQVVSDPEETFIKWGWNVPRVSGTTWIAVTCPGIFAPWPIKDAEGWAAIDSMHEDNKVFAAVLDRFAKRFDGRRPFHAYACLGYDIGNVFAVGLARAKIKTRQGLKEALDSIRCLPAATGGPGTVISFGPYDRRGLKGPDYLVLRTVKNGKEMAIPVER
ncbi:MAG: ABC transporter substrate-binding protein [Steroidobacteraceae bacterium]